MDTWKNFFSRGTGSFPGVGVAPSGVQCSLTDVYFIRRVLKASGRGRIFQQWQNVAPIIGYENVCFATRVKKALQNKEKIKMLSNIP